MRYNKTKFTGGTVMTLAEKLSKISKTSQLKKLNNGKSEDLEHLWKNIVEPLLPDETAVRQWHQILLDYVSKPEAIFFLRAYGSHSRKTGSDVLRRGFYNISNYNFSTFYGDNSFPWLFYSMAYDGFAPKDVEEFEQLMRSRKFPCGCIQTTAEKQYAAFFRGKNPGITTKGYKLAHIYSAGERFNISAGYSKISDFCKDVFPRGINTDWADTDTDTYGTYHYRKIDIDSQEKADNARRFLVAHFLRAVHPLNYFLVPKENSIEWTDSFGDKRHEIGEYSDLIKYVGYKIKEKYSKGDNIYDEFLNLIYPLEIYSDIPENKQINAKYKIDGWKNKKAVSIAKTKKRATPPAYVGSSSKTAKTPIIEFIPSNEKMFKTELLKAKKAEIIYEYNDGHVIKRPWDASEIVPDSNVRGNIRSKKIYRDDKDKIYKITVII